MSKVVGTVRREPGTVRRRGREVSWRTRARARLAAAGVVVASVVLPVTNATPAAAVDGGTYAYVTNNASGSVSVIDTRTNLPAPGSPITVGNGPKGVAVTPDGKQAYVTIDVGASINDVVRVIDTATNDPSDPIAVGNNPTFVAITPDGKQAYVTNSFSDSVSVIDTTQDPPVVVETITAAEGIGDSPIRVAITPDGTRAYVTNEIDNTVSVIDTTQDPPAVVGPPILVGDSPVGVATNPVSPRVYVANSNDDPGTVTVIDTATNLPTPGSPITVGTGSGLSDVTVTPDGTRAYVTDQTSNEVWVIDTATETVLGLPIPVGAAPIGVAASPAGGRVYTANAGIASDNLSVIDTSTNTVYGPPIPTGGTDPLHVAVAAVPGTGTIECPAGTFVTGGGAELTGPAPGNFVSEPVDDIDDAWEVSLTNPTNQDITVRPYAVCGDAPA
ncbi:beta-propeller fold lactonase family protein [Streptomyces sp. NPDC058572]|uniref:beta-propeller fold lactonase family protein n=1 Tax=Streptomyces sp. NPDC058572 TaxID=3346546 RepID=UPI00366697C1